MAEENEIKETKTKKMADPVAATIDPASQQMIQHAHEIGIETSFDRAVTMKPCNIGTQGICCPGVYTVFGVTLPVSGAPVFQKYIFEEFEKLYGGMWDLEVDPIKHAQKMIAHIDKKRQALGIDKARDRILVDMATRRDLGAV